MIRSLFLRVWALPWPPFFRRMGERLIKLMWLQRLVVPQFLVGVIGLVVNERGEILLLRHTYRHAYPWGLPTGFLERGEQPVVALCREIREETGFTVTLSDVFQAYTDADRPLLNIVFLGRYSGGEFRASQEVSEARFYPRDRLPMLLPDQRRLIDASQEVLH